MTREEKQQYLLLLNERFKRESRSDLLHFTMYTMPTFRPADFHKHYYSKLTEFADGKVKKLMVFIPPQHGKSEGSTRRLPSFLLGKDPNKRIAIVSYNSPKARKFNREIQRVIDTPEYRDLFPNSIIGKQKVEGGESKGGNYIRTSEECEMVGYQGGFKTVGVGGALTGEPVDILIMDDLYKDAMSAWSPTIRGNVSDWYDTVADTRLHNESQQLIVFTRWHEDDLAGRLLREEGVFDEIDNPNGWEVIIYRALKEGKPTKDDPRKEGEALWEERHSREKLEASRKRNPQVFNSLYQQDPKPSEGLMYELGFREYSTVPIDETVTRKCYVDTADTGLDYLCAIIYDETKAGNYILDVFYTQKPMEYTEPTLSQMLTKWNVQKCIIESNNGGRGFARNVEKQTRELGNTKTSFKWFNQNQNKQVRIFTHSADVQNLTFFPIGWIHLFSEFAKDILGYLKSGKNAHDDAPDCLTGTVEQRKQTNRKINLNKISRLV